MKEYKERLELFLFNKYYMLSIIVIALIGYSFSITHMTISIDDLEGYRYVGEGHVMLSAGRFGMIFWGNLISRVKGSAYSAYTVDLIATLLFILAAIHFCMLLQKASGDHFSLLGCILFSCCLISYPLINEIWEYTGANLCVCGGYLFVAISGYCMFDVIHLLELSKIQKFSRIAISLFCMTIVCSAYESLAAVYVLQVFCILLLQTHYGERRDNTLRLLIKQGLIYASALVGGIVLRFIVHRIILVVFNLSMGSNGDTEIYWLTEPVGSVIINLAKTTIISLLQVFWSYPIQILALAATAFVCLLVCSAIKSKNITEFLMGVGVIVSVFSLSIVQGKASPNRTCQTFALFVAFSALLLYDRTCQIKKYHSISVACAIILALLCVNQATYLSYLCTLNHVRSEHEAYVVETIGTDIERESLSDKPIVFVGQYELPESVLSGVTATDDDLKLYNSIRRFVGLEPETVIKVTQTNVNSVINWAVGAFGCDGKSIEKLFAYYGHPIVAETGETNIKEAENYAEKNKMPCYPQNGYIQDCGDYVIVNLG